ncbi:MAG: PstS family phosphate ABC transporter substrate-binding protein [Candidatus Nanopelagicales bacterium]|nr:PstS family phosphate ABC transporter substrate-binding protein [Candidatus Nanopelagicales bacterium]
MSMRQTRATAVLGLGAAAVLTLTACGGSNNASSTDGESGSVRIDGSSTVYPLTAVAAEDFQVANPGVRVTVGSSGTGGGFEKFCRGETDANDASRPIKDDEVANCEANGIDFASLTMAIDALTVVVNKDNDWATCLTTDQLAQIWSPESTVTNWNQVDPAFPDEPVALFGPGTDSGTFDYFTEEINGESGASRTDYTPSEDDNVIVQGVSGSKGGLGYFGYTYFEENADSLKALSIDSGAGCVAPSVETARDGSYTPLARPLFVYVSGPALQRPEVGNFFQYFVDNNVSIAESALYIPLSEEGQAQLVDDFAALESMGGAE